MAITRGWKLALSWMVPGLAVAQPEVPDVDTLAAASPAEQLRFVEEAHDEVARTTRALARMVERSDHRRDDGAVRCLAVPLASLESLSRVTAAGHRALADAVAVDHHDRVVHELRKASVAVEKSRSLLVEGGRCVTPTSGLVATTMDVTGAPPLFEPAAMPDLVTISDPPPVSPFQ